MSVEDEDIISSVALDTRALTLTIEPSSEEESRSSG